MSNANTTRDNVLAALCTAKACMQRDLERHNGLNPPEVHLRTAVAHMAGVLFYSERAISDELWSILKMIDKAGF